jgi:hypothetical protein
VALALGTAFFLTFKKNLTNCTVAIYLVLPISKAVISAARRLGNRRRRTAQGPGSGAALAVASGSAGSCAKEVLNRCQRP